MRTPFWENTPKSALNKLIAMHAKAEPRTVRHDQKRPAVYKVSHFTPQRKSCWCWLVMVPLVSVSGPQTTITGETVDTGAGTTMWTSLAGAPNFETRAEALRWVSLLDVPKVIVDAE